MHPMAAYAVLRGCALYVFLTERATWRIAAAQLRYDEPTLGFHTVPAEWRIGRMSHKGVEEFAEYDWYKIPSHMLDKLTPELIDQLITR